uniref:Uncharacterized protein LOC100367928 n=1 Tax=Saccoglossus kowalevskii TaxID=10224 RepID=A0ABM0GSM2_SACKO|nr:PREDICTED: uncharacterized protein LOC100367928 [Saccoglossus kowalevskii]
MDGVATRDRKPSSLTGIMGRQTCHHVEQDTEILEQLLEVHFEGLNQPVEPPKVDPSKFCDDICGWLPDPNVQFRRPEKLKNNSTVRPISCRKPRQVSNRENFQFIHHSDSKRYIEQYRRLHTCGGPLEKLTQDTQGKDTSIYYTPLDQHRETNGNTNSYKHSHKTHTPTVNRAPLNYVATPRDIAPFDCLVKPSVTQYKPMYNIQSSSPHEADTGTGNNNNNNSDSGTSRSSSSETSCKCAYINSNGMVFSLPKPRLYVAPKSPSGINVSAPPGGLGRSPHRQSPPNGFSFDRNIGKLTSTVGRTLTEKLLENAENSRGSSKDMTATGYNIMTVDKKMWFDTNTGKAYMSLSTRYMPTRKW